MPDTYMPPTPPKAATPVTKPVIVTDAAGSRAYHPFVNFFPKMDPLQFDRLVESIRTNGLHHPVLTHKGLIVDGYHRAEACLKAGVPLRIEEFDEEGTEEELWDRIHDENARRRDLSTEDRALIVAKANKHFFDKTGKHKGDGRPKKSSARLAYVSPEEKVAKRSLVRATLVLKQGSPDMIEQVETRKLSLYAAEKLIRAATPKVRDPAAHPVTEIPAEEALSALSELARHSTSEMRNLRGRIEEVEAVIVEVARTQLGRKLRKELPKLIENLGAELAAAKRLMEAFSNIP